MKKKQDMTKKDIQQKIAQLESINDQLLTELGYVDHLMRLVGFSNGLATVKLTAHELSKAQDENEEGAA